jgi:hypothetical protein
MSIPFKETLKFLPSKKQIIGFACNAVILKEINLVAEAVNWSRSQLIAESILHLVHLIEGSHNQATPDYIAQALTLDWSHITEKKTDIKKPNAIQYTAISLHPVILKKVDNTSKAIGWSRNAFIEAMRHTLNMIKDKNCEPIPNVVKIARSVIHSVTLK